MAHWKVKEKMDYEFDATCSVCGYTHEGSGSMHVWLDENNSCPWCNTRMDECPDINQLRLQDMSQYHLGREVLCNVVRETIGYDTLMHLFCYGQFNQTDEFAWFRIEDEFYIVHLRSGMMVNWYKHLGRTNTCSQDNRTLDDYYEFFNRFKMDLKYWAIRHGVKL